MATWFSRPIMCNSSLNALPSGATSLLALLLYANDMDVRHRFLAIGRLERAAHGEARCLAHRGIVPALRRRQILDRLAKPVPARAERRRVCLFDQALNWDLRSPHETS